MEFWEIYDQYHFRVKRMILVLVRDEWAADDLTQETFAKVQDHLNGLRDPGKLSSWIFRIAFNLCQDYFRKMGQSPDGHGCNSSDVETEQKSSLQKEFEQRQMGACVQDEMDRLPHSLRMVLILSDIMEFRHREIADLLGITVDNVKVRLYRARRRLKALLEQKCMFETDERGVLICEPKETANGKE